MAAKSAQRVSSLLELRVRLLLLLDTDDLELGALGVAVDDLEGGLALGLPAVADLGSPAPNPPVSQLAATTPATATEPAIGSHFLRPDFSAGASAAGRGAVVAPEGCSPGVEGASGPG